MSPWNRHETAARTEKAIALLDQLFARLPGRSAAELVPVARGASPALWADLAELAGLKHPPSATTVALIVTLLERKAWDDDHGVELPGLRAVE